MYYTGEQNSYNNSVLIYRYENTAGDSMVYAVWAPTSNETVINGYKLNITNKAVSANLVELADGEIHGVKTGLSINRNSVSINVSEKPVFVVTTSAVPTALPEHPYNQHEIMLYPNPVHDQLTVKITSPDPKTGPAEIIIRNLTGEIIRREKVFMSDAADAWHLNVESLAEGTYFLELVSTEGTSVKKLVKIQ
jgi:hypothetical protein